MTVTVGWSTSCARDHKRKSARLSNTRYVEGGAIDTFCRQFLHNNHILCVTKIVAQLRSGPQHDCDPDIAKKRSASGGRDANDSSAGTCKGGTLFPLPTKMCLRGRGNFQNSIEDLLITRPLRNRSRRQFGFHFLLSLRPRA